MTGFLPLKRHPGIKNEVAIIDETESVTFKELNRRIQSVAFSMSRTYAIGDRIGIHAENSVNYVCLMLGLRLAGMTVVPINTKLPIEQKRFIVEDSGMIKLYTEDLLALSEGKQKSFNDFFEELAFNEFRSTAPEDRDAYVMYTSGSTGKPKGVIHTHASRVKFVEERRAGPRNKALLAAPLYHINGISNTEVHVRSGSRLILLRKYATAKYLEAIDKYQPNILQAVPPMIEMFLRDPLIHGRTFPFVEFIRFGSAPVRPKLVEDIRYIFPYARIQNRYGMTELGSGIFGGNPDLVEPVLSVGWPRPDCQYKLVDGVLHVKTPYMLRTYNGGEAVPLDDEGYFNTKDRFTIDENGWYFFEGRADDMFVSGGENIFPIEIENVLETHPKVHTAAVISLPDEVKGQKAYAFYVGDYVSEDELFDYVAEQVAPYKIPRRIWSVPTMPLTGANKIDKQTLIQMALERINGF